MIFQSGRHHQKNHVLNLVSSICCRRFIILESSLGYPSNQLLFVIALYQSLSLINLELRLYQRSWPLGMISMHELINKLWERQTQKLQMIFHTYYSSNRSELIPHLHQTRGSYVKHDSCSFWLLRKPYTCFKFPLDGRAFTANLQMNTSLFLISNFVTSLLTK